MRSIWPSRTPYAGKRRRLYFGRIGYVTQPEPDRRGELFVRAEVLESRLGVASLHIPNGAVRSYFYSADRGQDETNQPTLYAVLRTLPSATPGDLRLSYRMRRVELESDDAAKTELQRAERAFNLLAHPELRSCYDALLINPDAPALFPYGGFGQCVVSGELAEGGETFFVRRILSYLPDQRQRTFRAPLRRIDFLDTRAIYQDSRRKAEVHLDPIVLPLSWDPTWNQWKHLVGAKTGISGTFVAAGRYRLIAGEWQLVRWETALPSRLSLCLPPDAQVALSAAKRAYQRFGDHYDEIQRVRLRLEREPLDEQRYRLSAGNPGYRRISMSCNSAGSRTTTPTITSNSRSGARMSSFSAENTYFRLRAQSWLKSPNWGMRPTSSRNRPTSANSFARTPLPAETTSVATAGMSPITSASWDASCTAVAHAHGYANFGQGLATR